MQVEGGGVLFFWRNPFDAEINNDLLFEVTGQSTYASRGNVDTRRPLDDRAWPCPAQDVSSAEADAMKHQKSRVNPSPSTADTVRGNL